MSPQCGTNVAAPPKGDSRSLSMSTEDTSSVGSSTKDGHGGHLRRRTRRAPRSLGPSLFVGCDMPWAIAFTYANQEYSFERWMLRRGVRVYIPRSRGMVRPRRLRHMVETMRPAFGNYAFVELENNAMMVAREAPSLNYLMRNDGELIVVSDFVIGDIMMREKSGEFDHMPEDLSAKFILGTEVFIVGGIMEGCKGIVVRKSVRGGKVRIDIKGKIFDLPLVLLKNVA